MPDMVLLSSTLVVSFSPFHMPLRKAFVLHFYTQGTSVSERESYPGPFVGTHSVPSSVLSPKCVLPYRIPTTALGRCNNPRLRKQRLRGQEPLVQTTQLESGGSGTYTQGFLARALPTVMRVVFLLLESPSSVVQGAASPAPAHSGSG